MNILKQILKEFWIPLTLSIVWTIYNIYGGENRSEWSVQKTINTFGATFFLLSWLTGQFFRVKKQTKVEDSFGKMEIRFKELLDKLETKTEETIAHISGGNSYPWVQVGMLDNSTNIWGLMVINQGVHPLYDVNVRITDLQKLAHAQSSNPPAVGAAVLGNTVHIGNMIPLQRNMVLQADFKGIFEQSYNIFFTARNGHFIQLLRFKKVNDSWKIAIKVTNQNDALLYEQIDESFPRNAEGNVAW